MLLRFLPFWISPWVLALQMLSLVSKWNKCIGNSPFKDKIKCINKISQCCTNHFSCTVCHSFEFLHFSFTLTNSASPMQMCALNQHSPPPKKKIQLTFISNGESIPRIPSGYWNSNPGPLYPPNLTWSALQWGSEGFLSSAEAVHDNPLLQQASECLIRRILIPQVLNPQIMRTHLYWCDHTYSCIWIIFMWSFTNVHVNMNALIKKYIWHKKAKVQYMTTEK